MAENTAPLTITTELIPAGVYLDGVRIDVPQEAPQAPAESPEDTPAA